MLLTIKKEQCILSNDGQRLITEASDIGLSPGISMPEFIAVLDAKNEGFLFQYGELDRLDENEIYGWNYHSTTSNFTLLVIND